MVSDYLYIPIGGNRGGTLRTYRNLYVVFALTGLWHGAAWSFLVWGLYHGTLLVLERASGLGRNTGDPARPGWIPARRGLTFLLVVLGWVPFRAPGLPEALHYLGRMFSPHFGALPDALQLALTESHVLILALALTVVLLPRSFVMGRLLDRQDGLWPGVARFGYVALAAPYAAVLVAAGTFSPFLYFQF